MADRPARRSRARASPWSRSVRTDARSRPSAPISTSCWSTTASSKRGKAIAAIADRIWYPVWDSGIGLDHSVRTISEAIAVADEDLKAAMGLLDARHVAGDESLSAELTHADAGALAGQGRPPGCPSSPRPWPNGPASTARSPSCSSRT